MCFRNFNSLYLRSYLSEKIQICFVTVERLVTFFSCSEINIARKNGLWEKTIRPNGPTELQNMWRHKWRYAFEKKNPTEARILRRFWLWSSFCLKPNFRSSHRKRSVKELFLKKSHNLQENSCVRVSFWTKLQDLGFTRTPPVTASAFLYVYW